MSSSKMITDTTGRVIQKNDFSEVEVNLKIENVSTGIYILSISHKGAIIQTKKIMLE